jgi:hypothetical protein
MTSSTSSSDPRALVAAVLLPLLILGGWYGWLAGQSEEWPPSALALEMDAELAAAKPEIVILGNSASYHAVDPEQLKKELGIQGTVSRLFVPASRSAAWYAVLKNRILAQPDKPKLVVVVASLHHMIDLEMNESRIDRLRGLLTADDDLIRERALGGASWPVLDRSRQLADNLFEVPKRAAVGLFFDDGADPNEALLDRGQRIAEAATAVVFNIETGTDMSLHRRVLPVAEVDEASDGPPPLDPEQAFLAEMADLANANGIRLVFAWFPLPASNPAPNPGVDLQRRTIELVNAHNAGWIDLHTLPLSQSVFFDHIHMNEAGRRQFTEALAEELKRIDALGSSPFGNAPLPIEVGAITRTGAPAPLPPLGAPVKTTTPCRYQIAIPELNPLNNKALYDAVGIAEGSPLRLLADGVPLKPHIKGPDQACDDTYTHGPTGILFSPLEDKLDGRTWTLAWETAFPAMAVRKGTPSEVWWVLPGTSVRIEMPAAWPAERGPFAVRVEGQILGEGGAYQLAIGADRQDFETTGTLARALATPAAPTGPWSIEITAPAGSAPLFLERVSVGQGPTATAILGAPSAGQSTRLLGAPHPGRKVSTASPVPEGSTPAPARRIDRPEPTAVARVPIGVLEGLGPGDVYAATTVGSCSPIRLLEDGVPLALAHTGIKEIVGGTPGAYRVQGSTAMFTSSDLSDPTTNGRSYKAVLTEERACGQAVWVYPGDLIRIEFDPARLSPLGATRLVLSGATFRGEPAGQTLDVMLDGDGVNYLSAAVPLSDLASGLAQINLDQPIPGTIKQLVLQLASTAGSPYVIVTSAELDGADEMGVPSPAGADEAPVEALTTLDGPVDLPLGKLGPVRDDPANVQWIESDPGGSTAELLNEDGTRFVRLQSTGFGASRVCSQLFPAVDALARAKVRAPTVKGEPGVKHAALRLEVLWRDGAGKPVQSAGGVRLIEQAADWAWADLPIDPPAGAAKGQLCLRFARSTGRADLAVWRLVPAGG